MERDPNRLTGLTETDLERLASGRARRSLLKFIAKTLLQYWWVVAFTLAALGMVVVSIWANQPEAVTRYGSLVVLAGAATNYWVSSAANRELDDALASFRDLNVRNVAGSEARLAVKQAFPDAFVTTLAPVPDIEAALVELERQKIPFRFLEIGLVLFGTIIAVFGNWITVYVHSGASGC